MKVTPVYFAVGEKKARGYVKESTFTFQHIRYIDGVRTVVKSEEVTSRYERFPRNGVEISETHYNAISEPHALESGLDIAYAKVTERADKTPIREK